MQSIIGWDIGGAHLKAARLEAGRIVKVVQIASPLWEGIDDFASRLCRGQGRARPRRSQRRDDDGGTGRCLSRSQRRRARASPRSQTTN